MRSEPKTKLCAAYDIGTLGKQGEVRAKGNAHTRGENAHTRPHPRIYRARVTYIHARSIKSHYPFTCMAAMYNLFHPGMTPFFYICACMTTKTRRVWLSSGYFGVKMLGTSMLTRLQKKIGALFCCLKGLVVTDFSAELPLALFGITLRLSTKG